jgi:predicted transcriptional regulator
VATDAKEIDTMANTKKMTKREMFEQIKANYSLTTEEVAFINHELELLVKKNSAEKKPTAVQVANEGIKQSIVDGMEVGKKYTITDIMKSIDECAELSNQRVSALVRQLVTDGVVVRTEEKRKAYFSLAD